jgi:hypothetical protein
MRDNRREFLKRGVAARMVSVRVRVNHKSKRLVREALHLTKQLVRDIRAARIYEDDTIFADRRSDIAIKTL